MEPSTGFVSSPRPGGKPLEYGAICAQLGFLEGKVLTVIDASYADERQNKAVKDLVKNAFVSQRKWIEFCCYPEQINRQSAEASKPE